MASSQKKTTNKKSTAPAKKQTTTRRKRVEEPVAAPKFAYRREVGAAVCLLLTLCVAVSYFSADGIFLAIFSKGLKGLFGYGYWVSAPVLAVAGVNLLRHKDRPVVLRTVCTLVLPLLIGVLVHLLLCRQTYEMSIALLGVLWKDGQTLLCGGALGGLLAVALNVWFGKIVAVIVFLVLLVLCVFGAFHLSLRQMIQNAKERRAERTAEEEAYAEEQEEFPMIKKEQPVKKRRASFDIPLDDDPTGKTDPSVLELKQYKSFFERKSADVRTPDQVLCPEKAVQEQPEVPVEEKKPRRTKAAKELQRQEVEQAADEVSRAIEDELALPIYLLHLYQQPYMNMSIDYTQQHVCADGGIIEVPFSVSTGTPRTYDILFSKTAKECGFKDRLSQFIGPMDDKLAIELSDSLQPGLYDASLVFHNLSCDSMLFPISFAVYYEADSLINQRWNDFLSVRKSAFDAYGGFTDYQWYKDDKPIAGQTGSQLYLPEEGLDTASTYSVELTRVSDGVRVRTCPYSPVIEPGTVTLTVWPTVVTSQNPAPLHIRTSHEGQAHLYNQSGLHVVEWQVHKGNNQLNMPTQPGLYLLRVLTESGQQKVHKIIVK